MSNSLFEILPKCFLAMSTSWGPFYFFTAHLLHGLSIRCTSSFLHHTVPSQVIRTVHFFIFAPYSFFINYLYGMLLNYCTAQFFHKLSVRCTFSFLHRTVPSQVIRTVHFFIFAPHSPFSGYPYGALLHFCTAQFLHKLSILTLRIYHVTLSPVSHAILTCDSLNHPSVSYFIYAPRLSQFLSIVISRSRYRVLL